MPREYVRSVVKYTRSCSSRICTACRLHVCRSYTDENKTISMSIDLRETFEQNRNHIMKITRSRITLHRNRKKPRVNGITTAEGIMRTSTLTKHDRDRRPDGRNKRTRNQKNRELRTITPGSARCHPPSLHLQYPSPTDKAKKREITFTVK